MSAETDSLIRFMQFTGVPHRVTDISTPGVHTPTSWHYQGLAVDFAGPVPGVGLDAVYSALAPLAPVALELFYKQNLWKNGKRITNAGITASHQNHVHIAVPVGWRFTEVPVPDDPQLPNLFDIKFFVPVVDATGMCKGYYMVSSKGEVHAHGPGAVYYGRSEVL